MPTKTTHELATIVATLVGAGIMTALPDQWWLGSSITFLGALWLVGHPRLADDGHILIDRRLSDIGRFRILMGCLIVALSIGIGIYKYQRFGENEVAAIDRMCAKTLLSRALRQGAKLYGEAQTTEHSIFEKNVNDWGQTTVDLIENAFGEGEARLFMDGSGLPLYSGNNDANQKQRFILDVGRQRLALLIPRIDLIPMQPDFHPNCADG